MILAIDPGPEKSGWVLYENGKIQDCGIWDNNTLLYNMDVLDPDRSVIEMVSSYGMAVGKSVFETVFWIGRLYQKISAVFIYEPTRMCRKDVKMHLCGSMRAKDANIRQALIDKFPATGGGKVPQIGTKSKPGPLYGVKGDIWAALALAVTFEETVKNS